MLLFHNIKRVLLAVIACIPIAILAQTNCQADHIVLASNFEFTPNELVIAPGESVAFINVEGNHTINGITNTLTQEPYNNPFDFFLEETEGIASGVCMGVITFDAAGTYNFDCSMDFNAQLGMTGTIIADAFTLADVFAYTDNYFTGAWQSGYAFTSYLSDVLNGEGPFTVFVPNDDAVEAIREIMNLNQFDLVAFYDMIAALEYHVIEGIWMADDLEDNLELPTLYGQNMTIHEEGGFFYADSAKILTTDFLTDNGVIHVIDKCLAPSGLPKATVFDIVQKSPDHEILEQALIKTNLKETLKEQNDLDPSLDLPGPFTIFAPTDAAFQLLMDALDLTETELLNSQILDDIVYNHVFENDYYADELFNNQLLLNWGGETNQIQVNTDGIFFDGIAITVADIAAYNGVVHVIEAISIPDLPPTSGTCGTWRLVLQDQSGYGWDDAYIDVVIDGETISSETLISGTSSTFEFGVDQASIIDLYMIGYGSGYSAYKLYNQDNVLVASSSTASNFDYGPQSILGIQACGEEPGCGTFKIEMYDDYGDGWDIGNLRVYRNGTFDQTINMPYGSGPQTVFLQADVNDVFDFEYNSSYFATENSYKIFDQNNNLIVNEYAQNTIPGDANDIIACENTTSTESLVEGNINIYPNPSSGIVYLEHAEQIESMTVSDLRGRNMKEVDFNNGYIDCSNYPIGNYLLKIKLANTVEYHKFSIVR